MSTLILHTVALLTLFIWWPAVSAPIPRPSHTQIRRIEGYVNAFIEELGKFDATAAAIRQAVEEGRRPAARRLSTLALAQAEEVQHLWRKLESYTSSLQKNGHYVKTQQAMRDGSENLKIYLTIKHHTRHIPEPLPVLISTWRGFRYGESLETLPHDINPSRRMAGRTISALQSVILVMHNGGMIRGEVRGWQGHRLFLREVRPVALARQLPGSFRLIDSRQIAKLETFGPPDTITYNPEVPMPILTGDGTYSPYYLRPGLGHRLFLAPDDFELAHLVQNSEWNLLQNYQRSVLIDFSKDRAPLHGGVMDQNCEVRISGGRAS